MAEKRFRDPIYGYIKIDDELITQIIDTSTFQRLRDIIQTSYSPLYSSAIHNRFVHSIGVYHLGRLAVEAFYRSVYEESSEEFPEIQEYIKIFEFACLLHDVGHAPFSHTGEELYLEKGNRAELHCALIELTGDKELEKEITDNSYKAAPHELMSAIVAMRAFDTSIPKDKKSFFARCICGYKYANSMCIQKSYMNCMIELLNSKVIDVDRMDYLLRDSYMSGFDTVVLDYMRWADGICAVKDENGYWEICYNKSAVSIIENVVYAHDAERKWIQNHPVVLYEMYLLKQSMLEIGQKLLGDEKLVYEYLTEAGKEVEGVGKVRLMGDSDIRYLMKNLPDSTLAEEYYGRENRKHPLWKSEAEFQAIFQEHERELEVIEKEFDSLQRYLRSAGLPFIIKKEVLSACRAEVEEIRGEMKGLKGDELEKSRAAAESKSIHIKWMEILEKFAKDQDIKFEFLIIYTEQFNSGFRKQEFENVKFIFPEVRVPCKLGDVSNVLKAQESRAEKFFFLYYTRKKPGQQVEIASLVREMLMLANQLLLDQIVQVRLR